MRVKQFFWIQKILYTKILQQNSEQKDTSLWVPEESDCVIYTITIDHYDMLSCVADLTRGPQQHRYLFAFLKHYGSFCDATEKHLPYHYDTILMMPLQSKPGGARQCNCPCYLVGGDGTTLFLSSNSSQSQASMSWGMQLMLSSECVLLPCLRRCSVWLHVSQRKHLSLSSSSEH